MTLAWETAEILSRGCLHNNLNWRIVSHLAAISQSVEEQGHNRLRFRVQDIVTWNVVAEDRGRSTDSVAKKTRPGRAEDIKGIYVVGFDRDVVAT